MRRLLFLMPILLCAAVSAHAQSLDAFKQRLAEPTPGATLFNRAQVTVTEHDDAARAVADAARAGQRLYFEGFHRVCVFSDNGPAARDGAFAAKALFEETYPDVKVYVDYEIPYFIVSAGNCLTKEEAAPVVAQPECIRCGMCVKACPTGAVSFRCGLGRGAKEEKNPIGENAVEK